MTDEALLTQLRDAIVNRFDEIHAKQTDEPNGIWYSNYLATLLEERGQNLHYDYWTGSCDKNYFEKEDYWVFKLKPNVSATKACQALVDQLSILECGNVTQLVYYLAISDVMGQKAFDAYVNNSDKPLYISSYAEDHPRDSIFFDFLDEVILSTPSKENERPLELGQLAYFRNYPSYMLRHPTGVAQGYNSIYVGRNNNKEQLYLAFWKDKPKTEQEIIQLLKKRYHAPPDMWDTLYFTENPSKKIKTTIDPHHIFFDDTKAYSYRFNLPHIKELH